MRNLSLTQRLMALAVLALLPAIAAMIYFISSVHRQREQEVHELALRVGQLVSFELERIITGTEGTMYALSQAPVIRSFNSPACDDYLSRVSSQLPQLRRIVVADTSGKIRCRSMLPASRIEVSDRSYFHEAMATKEMVVGEYLRSKVEDAPALPLALAIRDGDAVTGVVITSLDLDWLGARLKDRGYFQDSALTIADRNGVILAREPFPEKFVGTRIPDTFMPLVKSERSGSLLVTSQDGTQRIIGYYPPEATKTGLYISAGISTEAAFAPVYASTYRSIAIAVIGGIATLAIAWLIGDRLIRRPVTRILTTVDAWKAGDTMARTGIAKSPSEVDSLASTIDDYMDALAANREERQKDEAHRTLLLGELEHRVKNMLATVQALASQTFKGKATDDSLRTFSRRLAAMGEAHGLLHSESWKSADLRETLETALRPFGLGDGDRIRMKGPELRITSRATLAISMAVHELATNAAKYGALSNEAGSVKIEWNVTALPEGHSFHMSWIEQNGPPVQEPTRTGFGSRMIKATLGPEFSANVNVDFAATGVVFRFDASASTMLAETELDEERAA